MKPLLLLTSLILISGMAFSQKSNSNYKLEQEDMVDVFQTQGKYIFKYPFYLKKGEYVRISYEVYDSGKLIKEGNIIDDYIQKASARSVNLLAPRDTTVFHRFYFNKREGKTLEIREVLPGLSSSQTIDISKVGDGDFNSGVDLKDTLFKKTLIVYYRGVRRGREELDCSTGSSKERLIKDFDYLILFFAERIPAMEAKKTVKGAKLSYFSDQGDTHKKAAALKRISQTKISQCKIDREDVSNVFKMQDIHVFKYPFHLKAGEYLSFPYEAYESGKIKEIRNNIGFMTKPNSAYDVVDKLEFFQNGTTLLFKTINSFWGGFTTIWPVKFNLSKMVIGDFYEHANIDTLSDKEPLLYYYGFFNDSENYKRNHEFLDFQPKRTKDEIIRDYDFLLIVYVQKNKFKT